MKKYTLRHSLISFMQDIDIKGIRRIAYYLPELLLPKPVGPLILKTRYGFYLMIDPVKDNGVERSIYNTGTYEKGTLFVIGNILREGDIFVDVGANIGLMSLFATSIVKDTGKIIAFEPHPETMRILKSNIELNNASNIETSYYALGKEEKEAKVYDRWDYNRGSATLIKPEIETDSYDVHVIPLVNYFKKDPTIRLIKIDVEGYELEALMGAGNILAGKVPPMLIVECSEMRENTSKEGSVELYEFLKGVNQYRLFKSSKGKGKISRLVEINNRSELPVHDNIYCFTNEHIGQIPEKIFKTPHPLRKL